MVVRTLTAAQAMEFAGLDRDVFNNAVGAGFYPCAPAVRRRSIRRFDLHDLLALWVYGRLIREGAKPRVAGPMACELLALIEAHPETDTAVALFSDFGFERWVRWEDFDPEALTCPGYEPGPAPALVSYRVWRLRWPRERALHELGAAQDAAREGV